MGVALIHLTQKDLYLGMFHTSSRMNFFYIFSTRYPYEVKCVMLESPFAGKKSGRSITEIRLHHEEIFTLELGIIALTSYSMTCKPYVHINILPRHQ